MFNVRSIRSIQYGSRALNQTNMVKYKCLQYRYDHVVHKLKSSVICSLNTHRYVHNKQQQTYAWFVTNVCMFLIGRILIHTQWSKLGGYEGVTQARRLGTNEHNTLLWGEKKFKESEAAD